MTTTKTLRMALFDEPLILIKEQPHQLLISTMSIGLMAGFASSNGIIHPVLGLVVAVGIEWAWLRGVTSDTKHPTAWGAALNYSAFILAALWGTLWVAESLNAYDPTNWGWGMAIIHVVPLVWLSLCSAMSHRVATLAERAARLMQEQEQAERERQQQAYDDQLAADRKRKEQELALWEQGQRIAAALEDDKKRRDAERKMQYATARKPMRRDARSRFSDEENAHSKTYRCALCASDLTMKQYAASKRWGHCLNCKDNK